jgi:hypothetical protein
MAFVTLVNSNAQLIFTDSAGADRNMTAFWVGGHPEFSQDPVEVTSIADAAKRNLIGLSDTAMSFNLIFDGTITATGAYGVCNTLRISANAGTAKNITYAPAGTASGFPKIVVAAKLTSMNFGGGVGERETFDVTFVADGVATFTTY